ncbi:WD40 repeat domain-containing protein, partial [Neoroseomonas rubea]|uniref:WD40 repeat domain-containing protein n=1 Tax=Neoroseomonas rubea TaxID=2748666 RepID=UPI0038CD5D44
MRKAEGAPPPQTRLRRRSPWRQLAAGIAIALTAGIAFAQAPPAEPPQQPFLRIEAEAHIANVARLATDAAGTTLATVSDDKTVRIWNLPEGSQRLVIRPPIGPGPEGELYAAALSPDGARLVVGGFTARSWDNSFGLYIYDARTGRLFARLMGLDAPANHIAFSPDGRRIAAGLSGRAGVKVWDATNGRVLFEDRGFTGPVRMVAFDRAGRLAASAADGTVRLYGADHRQVANRVPVQGGRPFGIAFSPEGALLAVGFENRLRVEILSATDLRTVMAPDVTGLTGEGLPAVTWAHDGQGGVQLHAAGYARHARGGPVGPAPAVPQGGATSRAPATPTQGGRGIN